MRCLAPAAEMGCAGRKSGGLEKGETVPMSGYELITVNSGKNHGLNGCSCCILVAQRGPRLFLCEFIRFTSAHADRVEDDPVEEYAYAHREGFTGPETADSQGELCARSDCIVVGWIHIDSTVLDAGRLLRCGADI